MICRLSSAEYISASLSSGMPDSMKYPDGFRLFIIWGSRSIIIEEYILATMRSKLDGPIDESRVPSLTFILSATLLVFMLTWAVWTAIGSVSNANMFFAPSLAAVIASMPEPVPHECVERVYCSSHHRG